LEEALRAIEKAEGLADLVELRVDYLREQGLELLLRAGQKPMIVTNRRKDEGGKYKGEEKERIALLQEAIGLGASYVDVEMRSEGSSLRNLLDQREKTKLILSFHHFQGTPSPGELRILFGRMVRRGADVVKIVTMARTYEDNLKVLSLLPYARARMKSIVAFCMGPKGKMSRIFAPLMGAAWTYASLDGNRSSAPGQLTVHELRKIWKELA